MTLLDRAPGPPPVREWLMAVLGAIALLLVLRPVSVTEPFWWDASAVYVPGAHWLETHHFAARPGVFPSDLSRGHTPLFYLLLAFAFRAFGTSPAVGHTVVLGFATMVLAYTYALARWFAGQRAGIAAVVLLAVTPLFLTISSEALPEIPCTALTLAVVYSFARARYRECATWGCALILMKELTVAAPMAVGGAALLVAVRQRTVRASLPTLATLAIPVIPLAGFFAWQRIAEGWFITPYHASLFNEPHAYGEQFVAVVASMFAHDGRWIALAMAVPFAFMARSNQPDAAVNKPSRPTVRLALVLIIAANTVFYTRGWYLDRYLLPTHPGIVILIVTAFVGLADAAMQRRATIALGIAVLAVAGVSWNHREAGVGYASGETTFRYVHAIRSQQAVFSALEQRGGDPLVLTTWPMSDELREPYLGWVSRPFRVVNADYLVPDSPLPRVDAVIVFDGVGSRTRLRELARRLNFRLLREVHVGGATTEWWGP